ATAKQCEALTQPVHSATPKYCAVRSPCVNRSRGNVIFASESECPRAICIAPDFARSGIPQELSNSSRNKSGRVGVVTLWRGPLRVAEGVSIPSEHGGRTFGDVAVDVVPQQRHVPIGDRAASSAGESRSGETCCCANAPHIARALHSSACCHQVTYAGVDGDHPVAIGIENRIHNTPIRDCSAGSYTRSHPARRCRWCSDGDWFHILYCRKCNTARRYLHCAGRYANNQSVVV